MTMMTNRKGKVGMIRMVLVVALLAPAYAQAQTPVTPAKSDDIRAALRHVETSCADDYAKFCPVPATGIVASRDQVICLKTIKSDLSLACRRAVVAASR